MRRASIIFITSSIIFLTLLIIASSTMTIDTVVKDIALQHNGATPFWNAITSIGGAAGIIIISIMALYMFRKDRAAMTMIALAGTGSAGVDFVLKAIIARARPDGSELTALYSFPSGHTFCATAVLGIIAWLWARREPAKKNIIIATATFIIILVGISRIALNRHWLTDVIAGWALGIALIALLLMYEKRIASLLQSSKR